jgi:hypothetical protein
MPTTSCSSRQLTKKDQTETSLNAALLLSEIDFKFSGASAASRWGFNGEKKDISNFSLSEMVVYDAQS